VGLEVGVDVAGRNEFQNRIGRKEVGTYSLFLLPGIIPVLTDCNRPIICQEAEPPLE
jgi:hypothetical protein